MADDFKVIPIRCDCGVMNSSSMRPESFIVLDENFFFYCYFFVNE